MKVSRASLPALLPYLYWGLALSFTIANTLFHRKANGLADMLAGALGRPNYLLSSRVVAMLGLLLILFLIGKNIARNRQAVSFLLLFLALALVADLSLIVVPVERIHYVQYGILTWLFFLASGRPLAAALMAFAAGVLDEAYQFWVLYAESQNVYFDWNDLALNLTGALFVLFFLLPNDYRRGNIISRPVLLALPGWVAIAGLITLTLNPDQYLIRNDPYKGSSSFWILSNLNTTYHIMNAIEGLACLGTVIILTVGYYMPRQANSNGAAERAAQQ